MLRIAFIDPIPWDYVIDTPRVKPLGGSQSALCYLAEALVALGHEVAVMNNTKTPGRSRGAECFTLKHVPDVQYARYDAVIVLNAGLPQIAKQIRGAVGERAPIILWSQQDYDQPAVRDLADRSTHDAWDGFVLVSEWQAHVYHDMFGIRPERIKVIGNGICPVFENLFPGPGTIASQKPWPPVLCYTSTPYRGLDVLLEAFPRIRAGIPGTRLKVYSSMAVYEVGAASDPYASLYEWCRATEGVDYIGSLPQAVLAQELTNVTCLAYPNTYAETFCIAALEAMAAGCIVVTSDLGALPTTTAGFGHLLTPHLDKQCYAKLFADFAVQVLKDSRSSPAEHAQRLEDQVRLVNQTATWAVRAREWEGWLVSQVGRSAAHGTTIPGLLNVAMQHHQAGRLQEAEVLYRQVLQEHPNHADALHLLGLLAHHVGRHGEAVDLIGKAIALSPTVPAFHNNIGEAYRAQGKREEAVGCYRRAIEIKPDYADPYHNLGVVFQEQDMLEEAIAHFRLALAHNPFYAEALNGLGVALANQGKPEEAIASLRQAVAHKPDYAEAYNNLGAVLSERGELEEAVAQYRRAIALKPAYAEAYNNLGNALNGQGKLEEAIASLRQAVALKPDYAEAENQLMHLSQHLCDWTQMDERCDRQRRLIHAKPSALISPFTLLTIPSSAAEQLVCARNWAANKFSLYARMREGMGVHFTRTSRPRLRIGYLSADFRRHPVACLIAELFELHDRTGFEIGAYSIGPDDGSEMRARLSRACDRFVDLAAVPDVDAARRIHADGIDILIDLQGYTRRARTQIFALRPAPIQVNYLGYPGTMGAEFMDYIITDRFISPPDHEPDYAERLVYLPDCYQVNDRKREIAKKTPTKTDCGLPERGFVFCCFNNTNKIAAPVFDVWMRLLKAMPGSVLWLLEANSGAAANLRREATARKVDPERLVFAPKMPPDQHLARQRLADLFLDTLPYNAHVTASDALWVGLPVLTCAGATFASRVAGSLLTAVGLPELITDSLADYEALALQLARSPSKLARLRTRLENNRRTAPLFDSARMARHLERAYRMMWERYCKGEAPRRIEVSK